MADRGSFSEGGDMDLLVLLPDGRSVTHAAHSNCPMMDLLIQIASKENLKPSAYVIEPLQSSNGHDTEYSARPVIAYKPNTPIGMLNTQVIRLAPKSNNGTKMAAAGAVGAPKPQERKISHSESFSNRVQNFNKLSGHSAVEICNDPDGFNKLSEETKKIKSRSNYITSALPPQVTNYETTKQLMNTFRLQIHLPLEQLHVIRASPDYTIRDVLDILQDERGLKLEKYIFYKTNDPDLKLDLQGTLKEYAMTELTLKLKPEFDVARNNVVANPKKVKKESSSHFKSAFKTFFHQLKPSSRSNSVTELRHSTNTMRPKSEIPTVTNHAVPEFTKPKAPPRKRTHAPPPPVHNDRVSTMPLTRSHTASESSCESACEGSVGGSAPATLPRRCRLGPESVSTTNLAIEPPLPALRRGVSDLAVNKPKYPRRKRLAPRPPTFVSNEEIKEDKIEEQAIQKSEKIIDEIISSHKEIGKITESEMLYSKDNNADIVQIENVACDKEFENNVPTELRNQQLSGNLQIEMEETTKEEPFETAETKIFKQPEQQDVENAVEEEYISTENKVSKIVQEEIQVQPIMERNSPEAADTEMQDHVDDSQEFSFFPQKITNGHLVVVDINIDDPKDPNDIEPCEENAPNVENSQTDTPQQHNDAFNNKNDDNEISRTNSNVDVKVEIHHETCINAEEKAINEIENTVEFRRIPLASHVASSQHVEPLPAVDKPEHNVLPSLPRTVISVNSNRQSCTLPSMKLDENRQKKPPQRSVSTGSSIPSKPTVDDLLKQIDKIKQKSAKNNQNDIRNEVLKNDKKQNGHYQPEIVGLLEKIKSISEPEQRIESCSSIDYSNEFLNKRDSFDEPRENGAIVTCATPPVSPESEHPPVVNGNFEEAKSRLVTDVAAKLASVEKNQVSLEPVPRIRQYQAPSFMLTSWVEEKRPPVVNRIADYGSRSSVKVPVLDDSQKKERESSVEKSLPPALAATLPRPFNKPIDTTIKSSTINRPPTIINVLEKSQVQAQNEKPPNAVNGRQSVYAKLNLYNMTPKILVDSFPQNGNASSIHKPSWELVQDASKKFQEKKANGGHDIDINDNHKNNGNGHIAHVEDKLFENGTNKESDLRHVYKYPKPLQFQLGTWNDKTKGLKIEAEVKLEKKSDPPLVKDINEVPVWSATY